MAMLFAHGAIQWLAADPATTVYTVSGLPFSPQIVRFYYQGLASAVDAVSQTVSQRMGMGFWAGSVAFACATYDEDAAPAMVCGSLSSPGSTNVALTCDGTPTQTGLLDLNTSEADGFTVIVMDPPPVDITLFWEAWSSDGEITNAEMALISSPAAAGLQSTTSFTFQPDVLMFAGIRHFTIGDSGFCVGYASGTAAANNVVVCGNNDDGSANADTDGYCKTGECIAMIATAGGNATTRAKLNAFLSNGFQLDWLATSGLDNTILIVLGIKGGNWQAGSYTIAGNSAAATATVSGLPFTPIGVSLIGRMTAEQAAGTSTAENRIGLGTGSSTSSRRAMGLLSENGTAAAEIDLTIQYDQVLAYPSTTGTLQAAYDLNAVNADGFQVIVDTAGGVASEWQGYLAFGDPPAAGPFPPPYRRRPYTVRT